MKICDVTQFYSEVGGGVKRYVHEKRAYIERETSDEHILIIPGERTEMVREGRLVKCTVASPKLGNTSRYRMLLDLRAAEQFIHKLRPDVIESGDPYHLGWRAIDVAHEHEVPVLGFYHSHFPEAYLRTILKYGGTWIRDVGLAYAEDYIHRLYNSFDLTMVPSAYLVNVLESWGVTNARRVRLGVDVNIFRPREEDSPVRSQYGIPKDRELLLYVGRLAGEKNTKNMISAFRHLSKRHAGRFHFMVVGDGALRGTVEKFQEDVGDVTWVRFCSDSEELARIYRAATVFVHPGVCETFGLVTLESQACGCPVVGIRGSYMDTNIFAGLELWANRNEPEELADAIERVLASNPRELGLQASRVVHERFSWAQIFGEIWGHYREAGSIVTNRVRVRR